MTFPIDSCSSKPRQYYNLKCLIRLNNQNQRRMEGYLSINSSWKRRTWWAGRQDPGEALHPLNNLCRRKTELNAAMIVYGSCFTYLFKLFEKGINLDSLSRIGEFV